MQNTHSFETQFAGKTLKIETGVLALQANAAVTVQLGDSVVLATATISKKQRDNLDFFPLMVEFDEKLYAGGQIKGSRFIKREGRPSDEAVLTGRMIDRALRPMFDERIRNDIQVICTTLSYDPEAPIDVVALIAASAALHISDIPWNGPLSANRIGLINDELILNPTIAQIIESDLDLVTSGMGDKVIMVECGANEVPVKKMDEAFKFAVANYKPVTDLIEKARTAIGKEKLSLTDLMPQKTEEVLALEDAAVKVAEKLIKELTGPWLLTNDVPTKKLRKGNTDIVKKELKLKLVEAGLTEDQIKYVSDKASKMIEDEVSRSIIERDRRVDGRSMKEIRELSSQINLFPRTHGSAMFMRGETQVVSIVTLGSPGDAQILDSLGVDEKKRYMHHYNFPPYSVGEVAPMRGTGRREIGHGALAEKALVPVLPTQEEFPYTIRVVSETMGSNGSSSMASTCGSSISLMAAGVPIKRHVGGIAMGLVSDEKNGIYKVITDLQDLEDGFGGMDFKVTGTRQGITAIQLDTKTSGLPPKVVTDALNQSEEALDEVISFLEKTVAVPQELSKYAPRILSLRIDPEKIGEVIGSGGKVINEIIEMCGGVAIDIEDDGLVLVTGEVENAQKAIKIIETITKVPQAGDVFEGPVVRLMDFGAFIQLAPGKDGMCHVSEIAYTRIEKPADVLKVGDIVKVMVKEVDSMGRINLSMKALLPKPEGYIEQPPRPRPPSRPFNGGRR